MTKTGSRRVPASTLPNVPTKLCFQTPDRLLGSPERLCA